MKLYKFLLIVLVVALLSVSATLFFYSNYFVYKVHKIPMDVRVSDHIGFNLDTDALHFGIATSPGGSSRPISVINTFNKSVKVVVKKSGHIAEWVSISNTTFVLQPGQKEKVNFELEVPPAVSYGNYTGTITIYFKRNH